MNISLAAARLTPWLVVDWAVALYVIFVALVAIIWAAAIPEWPSILLAHGALLALLPALPRRGAAWERVR